MKELELFRSVASDPARYAERIKKESGKRVVGYFCSYGPEEIIDAAGCIPYRIFGSRESITRADAHLQAYSCSVVRGGLEDVLAGRLSFLDGTVFPHTCDSIQRLSDIWRLNAGVPFHFDVVLPVKLNTDSAREYLRDVLGLFRRDIEGMTGHSVTDEQLRGSIRLFNRIRATLVDIYRMKSADPGLISGGDLLAVVKSSMVMDRAEYLANLEPLARALKQRVQSAGADGRKRVLLAGGMCNHPDIYGILENGGASVVWDDLCTGSRHFTGVMDEAADPVSTIANRYFERIPCPAKHVSTTGRGDHLVRLARENRAGGVVFIMLKFCDPHSFDYPYLKESLEREGIRSMLLEIEEPLPPAGQLATRLETFVSTL